MLCDNLILILHSDGQPSSSLSKLLDMNCKKKFISFLKEFYKQEPPPETFKPSICQLRSVFCLPASMVEKYT